MRIFTREIVVSPRHIDIQNRVSNLCYVQWMQDLAISHSTVQGLSLIHISLCGAVRRHLRHRPV